MKEAWDDYRELNETEWAKLTSQQGFSEEVLSTAAYLPYQLIDITKPTEEAHAYIAFSEQEDIFAYFGVFETAQEWAHKHEV